ncbi:hypothetical protein [Haladaptatus sp. DYSN1]|uniref:hypothetical protein n=1 Tax=unclassified Haladaptatus TaxID=2622732 RepID=UPI002406B944|nr:hypothetical protein [Haladaptatus sp. DYSN1]
MDRLRRVSLAALTLCLTSGVASAHEVGGSRFEAPLPLGLLFAGAGLTVAITAVWVGFSATRSERATTTPIGTFSATPARLASRVASIAFLTLVVAAVAWGLFGKQVGAENPATFFTWWVWLKGLAVVSLLVGSPWRILSPWRTIYRGLSALEGRALRYRDYPSPLAHWPAVAGFLLVVGVFENLTAVPRDPQATATFVATYALVMILGGIVYGEAWFERADFFAVLYRLFGRVAPFTFTRADSGAVRLLVRRPWTGCLDPAPNLSLVAFIVGTVYVVSFDGFTSTPEFQTLTTGLRSILGIGAVADLALILVGFGLFLTSYALVALLVSRAGGRTTWAGATLAFAPSILPIAVAYDLAHIYPFVLDNTGQFVALTVASLTALPAPTVTLTDWLSLPVFWGSQVLLIIVGHVVAVVAAHGVAIRRYATPSLARRSHVPLVALMVGYTVLSLWIISRPVVTG